MTFELTHIILLGISYLLVLFFVAHAANAGWIPQCITNHPATYVLSMGISFSALSFYGVIELAAEFGYGALAYYMGTGAFFLFAPIIQAPLAGLCQRFQLRSIADLLVFRYSSQLAGSLATLFICLCLMPLLVVQIQAVADTLLILTHNSPSETINNTELQQKRDSFALFYCLLITAFCMVFGAGYSHYKSLITTMALESLIKVSALMVIGIFSVMVVFGGLGNLDQWLLDNGEYLVRLHAPEQGSSSHTLLLVFIATGVLMPHIFHMGYMGQSIHQVSRLISWAFPLFLLFMALPVFPILWAGFELKVALPIAYFTIGVPQYAGAPLITLIAWVGGLSAASGALVISILSLSTTILNQWLLPLLRLRTQRDIYAQLRWLRRLLIMIITLLGYSLYLWLDRRYSLIDLALVTFIQALQFVPGVVAVSYWHRANRFGFFAGLLAGTLVWFVGLVMPMMFTWYTLPLPLLNQDITIGIAAWEAVALIATGLNVTLFIAVSYLTPITDEERYHGDLCAEDQLSQPFRRTLDVTCAQDFKTRLAASIGADAADKEVNRALRYLDLPDDETRPSALRRLRTRIRTNLSGLLGHTIAAEMIDQHFPYHNPATTDVMDINLMETRLERLGHKMQGLTADINQLRLHHRNTLQELPMAVCSLGLDDEILLWNNTMAAITGIDDKAVTGSSLFELPDPWGPFIRDFADNAQTHTDRQAIDRRGNTRWYRLHKAAIQESPGQRVEGQVILAEDITDIRKMEQELLHNTRLAAIGRLAAGVAHEIGNPVTGIACLAQNLRYDDDAAERETSIADIIALTGRISRIVQSLVTFAHTGQSPPRDFQPVNIHQCIAEAVHLLSLQQERKSLVYRNQVDEELMALGDSQRLIQVFVNLFSNASDASPEQGNITVTSTVHAADHAQSARARIEVTDEGSGIDPDYLKQVVEPFFTTKEAGQGTGLGLSVVLSIIAEHKGQMTIVSPVAKGRGTCIAITLPLVADSA